MGGYTNNKPSSQGWLGEVPEHWELVRLGGYFDERREKVSDTDFQALSVTKGGVVPQLETAAKTDAGDNRKKVCVGDFVINSRSDRKGSSGLSTLEGSVSLISTVLEPRGIDARYVHHLLRSYPFQEEFYRWGKGIVADLWSTNYSEMKNIMIPLPSGYEQTAIANFLDRETARIDRLIERQERLIALLKEKRQAVISRAVTRGLDPTVPMKDSGVEWLGEVPGHWDVPRLKFRSVLQTGVAKGKNISPEEAVSVPYLRVANVQDGYLDLTDVAEIEIHRDDLLRYSLRQGDVLMNEGGDFDKLGRGSLWNDEVSPCIHQNHVFAIRPTLIEPEWITTVTQAAYSKFYFILHSKQSTNLASISSSNIKNVPIVVPPPDERQNILEYLATQSTKIDSLLLNATDAIELLQERRTALISAAVTGKIDVRAHPSARPLTDTEPTAPESP
ncbi:MAG: type I restriction endonuclease subunit S [Gammaproteobacteria bacterium]